MTYQLRQWIGKYWLKYAHSTNYWQGNIDKKWAKYTTCSHAMGMLNIERNAVHGTLLVHSKSKVKLTKIMQNVHIVLLIHSESKVILTKIMQNVHIMLLIHSQSKVISTKIIQQGVHYTTCS
jgi:hypothetical protein